MLTDNLRSVSKAVAGALVALIVAGLAQVDWRLGDDEKTALELLINGGLAVLIGFAGVYFAPRNTPTNSVTKEKI